MKATKIFDAGHQWIMFGRDPDKKDGVIDTNQYMVKNGDRCILLDPGGIEIFSSMLTAVLHFAPVDSITDLFASHQDPDIISSLGLWSQALNNPTLHLPWLWEGFIKHFGSDNITFNPLPDEGGYMDLGGVRLQFIPAHYLHASGNFHVYDEKSGILMSGDVGAALDRQDAPVFVEDFDEHIGKMEMFHQRWMPSNRAKNDWVARVRELDVKMMVPQHGGLFKGDMVKRFLDWFEELEVGNAIPREEEAVAAEAEED